ncbi:MAG: hypothetical protein WA885_10025 [Phormidesmis sp.]
MPRVGFGAIATFKNIPLKQYSWPSQSAPAVKPVFHSAPLPAPLSALNVACAMTGCYDILGRASSTYFALAAGEICLIYQRFYRRRDTVISPRSHLLILSASSAYLLLAHTASNANL